MKKLFTLLAAALLLVSPALIAGCEDSDKEVNRRDGELTTEVVIPTSMHVFKGMAVTVEGKGFQEGDRIALRAAKDLPAETTILSPTSLAFKVPEEVADQTTYKIVLFRQAGNDYQVLGASKLTVRLAVNIDLSAKIESTWGGNVTIAGNGFQATDRLFLKQGGGSSEVTVKGADANSLTFAIPYGMAEDAYEFILQRNGEEESIGTATFALEYADPIPDKDGASVKGIVHCQGIGIADVLVSDGDKIVKTDKDGYYYIPSDKRNGLVFVIQPSGYEVPTEKAIPRFWAKTVEAAGTVETFNFKLLKSENDNYKLVVATDMHLANRNTPKDYTQFADGFVKELTTAYNNSPEKVYCLNLGDFAWDGYWYTNKWALPECKEAIAKFKFPFWSVMGNHDNDPYVADDFGAETPYRTFMGPVYYSMNIGKIHYLMLDNTVYVNKGGAEGVIGDREYNKYFTAEQLAWIKEDLKHVDKSTPVFVAFHCPLYSNGWNVVANKPTVTNSLSSSATAELLDCFDGYTHVNVLSGHTHVNRNNQSPAYANVYEHNVAAVCGTWWWTQQYGKNNVCTDGSPAGYKVFDITGTDIKWQYKATGLKEERQFMTYDMNNVKKYWETDKTALAAFAAGNNLAGRDKDYSSVGENEVFINVWAWEPDRWTIDVTEEGKKLNVNQVWKRDPLHSISYDIPRGAANNGELSFPSGYVPHIFSVTASSAESTLEVTVTDRFGRVYSETMTRPKAFTTDLSK